MSQVFAVGYDTNELLERAKALAAEFHFTINNEILPRLQVTAEKLVLMSDTFSPLHVDFTPFALQRRRDEGKKQGLVRACKPTKGLRVLDATAGWGRDAAVLASFGADVLMLERQPMMAALLADALLHADKRLVFSLRHIDARSYLQNLSPDEYPDVIYIDPMHPERQKSALVKKDMQVLQTLFGADEDAQALIELAKTRARQRVVVKWPQRLTALVPPSFSLDGKTVRFDVYLPLACK